MYKLRNAILGFVAVSSPLAADIATRATDNRLIIERDGKLVAEYRGDTRIPCIYPLTGPHGSNVTRHWPLTELQPGEEDDHPHHVSFWLSHGAVNGVDFWAGRENERIVHEGFRTNQLKSLNGMDEVTFAVDLSWEHGGKPLLKEVREYRFRFEKEMTTVDVISTLTAVDDILFGDTKEGYFAIRLTPTLRLRGKVAKGVIQDSEGRTNDACWGKRAAWVSCFGPDEEAKEITVTMFDHPENLRHPTWWHARDYGLLAANPFGRHDFENRMDEPHLGDMSLAKGKSFTQRYRLTLYAGKAGVEDLKKEYEDFSK